MVNVAAVREPSPYVNLDLRDPEAMPTVLRPPREMELDWGPPDELAAVAFTPIPGFIGGYRDNAKPLAKRAPKTSWWRLTWARMRGVFRRLEEREIVRAARRRRAGDGPFYGDRRPPPRPAPFGPRPYSE